MTDRSPDVGVPSRGWATRCVAALCTACCTLALGCRPAAPAAGELGSPARAVTGASVPTSSIARSADAGAAGKLRIVFIDVEGGAATLLIAPSGETLLADAGWPGHGERDAQRIAAVVEAEVPSKRIDHCLVTHYHVDHVGGVAALARRVEIGEYIDHGLEAEKSPELDSYLAVANGRRRVTAKPGDRWMLGSVEIVVVASGGRFLPEPLVPKTENRACAGAVTKPVEAGNENPLSVGFMARFGQFDFLDLGDLTWAGEHELVCPSNRLGTVDLWQVDHHGSDPSNAPQFVQSIDFTAAVMDNGPSKGGASATFDTLKRVARGKDVWQLHRVTQNDAVHNGPDELIANLAEVPDAAHAIEASVASDGTFTVTNRRTGASRTYASR